MLTDALTIDIETSGRPHDGTLISLGWQEPGEHIAHVVPGSQVPRWVRDMLSDPAVPVIEHTKYDARWLRLAGWEVNGPILDTQVMAWVLNENQRLALDPLAKRYLGLTMDKRLSSAGRIFTDARGGVHEMAKFHEWMPWVQTELFEYNQRDVEATTQLAHKLWERMEESEWLDYYLAEELPFTSILLEMETSGLPVNLTDSELLREELEVRHSIMQRELLEEAGLPDSFNINSNDQLAAYLYHPVFELSASMEHVEMVPPRFEVRKVARKFMHGVWTLRGRGLPATLKTDSGKLSVSTPALTSNYAAMTDPWVMKLVAYRKVDKALTTYLRKYPQIAVEAGPMAAAATTEPGPSPASTRIYGRFNQTGTKTGRLSSSDPNLQNQPARGDLGPRMRALFQAPMVVGDYGQLEPRLFAHFSGDPNITAIYTGGHGDIYADMATGIWGEVTKDYRTVSKGLVLGMSYGAMEKKVAQVLTSMGYPTTEEVAKGYLTELHKRYKVFFDWRLAVIESAKRRGYVQTIGGRHRRLRAQFKDRKNWKNVGYGERQAVNAVIQGSAGDIVRRVMMRGIWGSAMNLLAQVHDELIWEWLGKAPPASDELAWVRLQGETAHGFDLRVPMQFEPHFGHNWYAAKEGLEDDDVEELLAETASLEFAEERA